MATKKTTLEGGIADMRQHMKLGNLLQRYDALIGQPWQYHLPDKKVLLKELAAAVTECRDQLTPTERKILATKLMALRTEVATDEQGRLAAVDAIMRAPTDKS